MVEIKELSQKKVRKNAYWKKLDTAINKYKNILVIGVDFVGSRQMQEVRQSIRGQGEIMMGKNTIIRKVLRENSEKNPKLADLIPLIRGNMGFIFCNGDLNAIRKKVVGFTLPASAKSGVIAPVNVVVPAGPTGLDPGQTSFFQTLNIGTKIVKGTIEIVSDVHLCTKGEKVSTSAVALLSKLNIKPFEYGIIATHVYEDGAVYEAAVLDLSVSDLVGKFCDACSSLAAISFAIGSVNKVTISHSFGRAFNLLAAVGLESGYIFEELKIVDEMIKNPGAFSGGGGAAPAGGKAGAAAAAEPEEEEEEAAPPAMDMFGGEAEAGADY
jgi:large subunit ribosomal protein LP0